MEKQDIKSMTQEELQSLFGESGRKTIPDRPDLSVDA